MDSVVIAGPASAGPRTGKATLSSRRNSTGTASTVDGSTSSATPIGAKVTTGYRLIPVRTETLAAQSANSLTDDPSEDIVISRWPLGLLETGRPDESLPAEPRRCWFPAPEVFRTGFDRNGTPDRHTQTDGRRRGKQRPPRQWRARGTCRACQSPACPLRTAHEKEDPGRAGQQDAADGLSAYSGTAGRNGNRRRGTDAVCQQGKGTAGTGTLPCRRNRSPTALQPAARRSRTS